MGDKSPKNNAKAKKQKTDKRKVVDTAKTGDADVKRPGTR